ncbi:MAG: hypothetical protein V1714_04805 [Pseudomonadota bacterium]
MKENDTNGSCDNFEWTERKLCIDENCIGVVGHDGRCRECGKPFDPTVTNEEDIKPSGNSSLPENPAACQCEKKGSGSYWQERTLCIDENCIGVVGHDGRCRECGKPYIRTEDET